jgi:hypothetical protein
MNDQAVSVMLMKQYALLGADLSPTPPGTPSYSGYGSHYQTLDEFVAEGPTWFRYEYGFGNNANSGDIWAYVNMEKMLAAGFDTATMAYNANTRLNTGYTVYDKSGTPYAYNDVPLYSLINPALQMAPNGSGGDPLFNLQSSVDPTAGRPDNYNYSNYPTLSLTSNAQFNKLTDCMIFSSGEDAFPGIYLYMPPKSAAAFVFELILAPESGDACSDNLLQFSFYKMRLNNPNEDNRLSAYGIEPIKGAVLEYFNGLAGLDNTKNDLWVKLQTIFGMP